MTFPPPSSNSASEALLDRLAPAVLAVMAGQRLEHLGIPIDPPPEDEVANAVAWLQDSGLNPYSLAFESLSYLHILHAQGPVVQLYVQGFAEILWQILGDPESGSPPPLYYKAAASCYSVFLQSFDTDSIKL
jgi:hypothetical protein